MRGIFEIGATLIAEESIFQGPQAGRAYRVDRAVDGRLTLQDVGSGAWLHRRYPVDLVLTMPLPGPADFAPGELVLCPVCWGTRTNSVHCYLGGGRCGWERRPCSLCAGAGATTAEVALGWARERRGRRKSAEK